MLNLNVNSVILLTTIQMAVQRSSIYMLPRDIFSSILSVVELYHNPSSNDSLFPQRSQFELSYLYLPLPTILLSIKGVNTQ